MESNEKSQSQWGIAASILTVREKTGIIVDLEADWAWSHLLNTVSDLIDGFLPGWKLN